MTSNAENEKRGELAGRADGRCWAEHTTEHDDLAITATASWQRWRLAHRSFWWDRLSLFFAAPTR